MIRQLLIISIAVMSTLLMLLILWDFRTAVIYALFSLALAATIRPVVMDWQNRGWKTRLVLAVIYAAALGAFGYLIFVVGKYVGGDLQQLTQAISTQEAWSLPAWAGSGPFPQALSAWLPTPNRILEALSSEETQFVLPAVLSFTEGIGGFLSGLLLILILSSYLSTNQIHFERLWLSLLPAEQRKLARDTWRTMEVELGAYLRSEIVQSLLAALTLTVGYWVLGCPFPVMLGVVGGLAWLFPVVGAALAIVLPLVVGLTISIQLGLLVTIYTLAVLIALQLWVEPRLFQRNWDNPILTLVLVLALSDAFGLIGILAAPLLSGICRILWNSLVRNRFTANPVIQVSELRERQTQLWSKVREMEEEPSMLLINSMQRLDSLLDKAGPVLPEVDPAEDVPAPFHPSQPVTAKEDPLPSKSG